MSRLISKLFTVILLLSAVPVFSQQSVPSVDMSVTVISLAKAAESGRGGPVQGTPVILNGTVLDRRVTNPDESAYSAEITLARGEWSGDSDVEIFKCIILLNGPEYSAMVPARRSRDENPKELTLNSEVIVYGVFLGYADTDDGPVAVIQSGGVRKL